MSDDLATLRSAQSGDDVAFARLVAPHRRALRAHCYRMSGALHEADDLLQESLLRAWRGLSAYEGRAALRTWLYTITTRACLDALDRRSARALPMDLGPAMSPGDPFAPPRLDPIWIGPCPADLYASPATSPEARHVERESVTLAFLAALQLLPPRQRAVLILRDVVGWEASECAELLDLTVAAVNSALQRARATVAARAGDLRDARPRADDPRTASLLARYVRAWELADVDTLVALLHEDATLAMPPLPQWLVGPAAIAASISTMVFQPAGPGAFRLVATEANARPAFAAYERDPATAAFLPRAMHILDVRDGRVSAIMAFLDPSFAPAFELPARLD